MESARARGYLNVRAAARWLMNRYDWDAEEEAIVSALRRYDPPARVDIEEGQRLLGELKATLETGLALIEAPATPEVWDRLQAGEELLDREGYRARLPGRQRLRLVVESSEAARVTSVLEPATGRERIEVREEIARVVLSFPEAGHRAMIASFVVAGLLGQNEVDTLGLHFTGQDVALFFDEQEVLRVHELVANLEELAPGEPGSAGEG